jgi:hypothetical protein
MTEEVTRCDDMLVATKEEVPEVRTSAGNQEGDNIRKAVAFEKQLAKADPIENTNSKTPMPLIV